MNGPKRPRRCTSTRHRWLRTWGTSPGLRPRPPRLAALAAGRAPLPFAPGNSRSPCARDTWSRPGTPVAAQADDHRVPFGADLVGRPRREVGPLEFLCLLVDPGPERRVRRPEQPAPKRACRQRRPSSSSSIRAVNSRSTNSPKWQTSRSVTISPTSSGRGRRSWNLDVPCPGSSDRGCVGGRHGRCRAPRGSCSGWPRCIGAAAR